MNTHTVKGLIAGSASVTAMDHLVTKPLEKSDSSQKNWASHVLVRKVSQRLGLDLSKRQEYVSGQILHYSMGVVPAILYSTFYQRSPVLRKGKGLLYGLGLFITLFETTEPALGLSGPIKKFPWQAHMRGLLGNLVLGFTTHQTIRFLDRKLVK